jgi:hypothetical protein
MLSPPASVKTPLIWAQTAEDPSPQPLKRQLSEPVGTAMRRGPSSKTGSGSAAGTSRPKQASSRPMNIPEPRFHQQWPATQGPFPAVTSHSLPVTHNNRPAYRPSLGNCHDMSPDEYLSQSPDEFPMPGLALSPSPTAARGEWRAQDPSRLSVSSIPAYAWDQYSSTTPLGDSCKISASTTTGERMSRTTTNDQLIEPFKLCRVGSQSSASGVSETPTTTNEYCPFDVESFFPESFNSSVLSTQSDVSLPSFSQSHFLPPSLIPASSEMLHSPSQESNASVSSAGSSQSGLSQRGPKQNSFSKRRLAPKSQHVKSSVAMPTTQIVEITAADGTRQQKAEIARLDQQPKETIKLPCPICNDHKEGFHGEHEVKRHVERAHSGYRKVFICKDISAGQTFLANCKHCRNKKTYGANYNAAAHLRRVHFNPCQTPKGGRGKVSQNRGGIGGGDHPSMDVLKDWMYEAWERNVNAVALEASPVMNGGYATSSQSSSSDSLVCQSNGAIQISGTNLDFVQPASQLDMFLRQPLDLSLDSQLHSSPISNDFYAPSQTDLPFFDAIFTN